METSKPPLEETEAGYIEVGLADNGQWVGMNVPLPEEYRNEDFMHFIFSPDQARQLAKSLVKQADLAERESAKSPGGGKKSEHAKDVDNKHQRKQ